MTEPLTPQALALKLGFNPTAKPGVASVTKPSSRILKLQEEARVAQEKARKENSFLGMTKNFLKAIPRSTFNVAKDIVQGVARSGGMVGLSLIGEDVLPPSQLSRAIFGEKPLLSVQGAVQKTKKDLEPYIGKTGSKFAAAPLVLGSIALDFTGAGGEKNVISYLAKINKESEAFRVLKQINVADDLAHEYAPIIAQTSKEADVGKIISNITDLQNSTKEVSQLKPIDKLIAENKIRVVSRDNRDVYQYKRAGEWVNARDEDSAVKQVTPKPKEEVPLPEELAQKKELIEIQRANLELNPARNLQKFAGTRGDFKGELREVTGNARGKFANQGDDIVTELGFKDSEDARQSFNRFRQDSEELKVFMKEVREEEKAFKKALKESRSSEVKTKAPQIEKSLEEVRSIEKSAREALQKVDPVYNREVSSLPQIIDKSVTDVKKKINILDYFRTPDRVLEKIGFAKEGKVLRDGYESYVKELPKNIDKITEWSKTKGLTKDSSKNIFRYLDGESVTLTQAEKNVATEIQKWLAEWADRLKLPKDNRITNYITHIFDKELLAKEFDEDLAKIIADRIPGQVYDPFLEKRLGAKGYIQDVWQALDAYVKRATRKANIDPALQMIRNKAGSTLDMANIEKSQFEYLQSYINNVNMRPTWLDNIIDNGVKSMVGYTFGQRPLTYIAKILRQFTFRGMLGLNVGSALRNLSQGVNTYAKLGEKYTFLGYSKLFSPGAMKELAEEGVLSTNIVQDRALNATKKTLEKLDKALFVFFDTAEKINRGAAYFGGKAKALRAGKSEKEAIEAGKKLVRDTQFNFGSVDTPVALQNDIVKTLGQFQTYTLKQTEFLAEMVKDKDIGGLIRYAAAGLLFTYTIGKAFGMKPEQLIPTFRFDTPPSLKFPSEVILAAVDAPDKYGGDRTLKEKARDVANSAIGLIPAGSQAKKTIEGAKSVKEGGVFTPSGTLKYEQGQSTGEKAQSLLFGKYASDNAQDFFNKEKLKEKEQAPIKKIYDQVQKLVEDGKEDEARAIVDGLTDEEYEIYKAVKTSAKRAATIKAEKEFFPTYQKIRNLVSQGKTDEAQIILDDLTDEEYRIYQLLKKKN